MRSRIFKRSTSAHSALFQKNHLLVPYKSFHSTLFFKLFSAKPLKTSITKKVHGLWLRQHPRFLRLRSAHPFNYYLFNQATTSQASSPKPDVFYQTKQAQQERHLLQTLPTGYPLPPSTLSNQPLSILRDTTLPHHDQGCFLSKHSLCFRRFSKLSRQRRTNHQA